MNKPADWEIYFDDIKGVIELLENEKDTESEHFDQVVERIAYLKKRQDAGDAWVDSDITASPTAWMHLETFSEEKATKMYRIYRSD